MQPLQVRLTVDRWFSRYWLPAMTWLLMPVCLLRLMSIDTAAAVLAWPARWAVRAEVV